MSARYTPPRRDQYRTAENKRRTIADQRRAARAAKLRARENGGKS